MGVDHTEVELRAMLYIPARAIAEGRINQAMRSQNAVEPSAAIQRNQSSLSNTAKSSTTTEKSRLATFFRINCDHAA